MFEFTTIFFMIGNLYMVVDNETYMLILSSLPILANLCI